jgi:phospholipid/cholesterol/gamma-HCH transport system substrate-binding protein
MRIKKTDSAKLGLFVLAGLLFLVLTLYMIGKNRNLLGSTFTLYATFNNVNGLVPGNNVRFSGIDVGTVKDIEIVNDTSIHVTMTIDTKVKKHIKQNTIATIATDGLMGNRLISLSVRPGPSEEVEEGNVLQSLKPVETDAMLRTLNTTNDNITVITHNLREITNKLNKNNSLWTLLSDSLIAKDIKQTVVDLRRTGHNTAALTAELNGLAEKVKQGEGLAGSLLTDTIVFQRLDQSMRDVQEASRHVATLTNDLNAMIKDIGEGKGTVGILLSDTAWAAKLHQSIVNVEQGTARFNENMEALKHNWLFRSYFRKQEKKADKEKRDNPQ